MYNEPYIFPGTGLELACNEGSRGGTSFTFENIPSISLICKLFLPHIDKTDLAYLLRNKLVASRRLIPSVKVSEGARTIMQYASFGGQ